MTSLNKLGLRGVRSYSGSSEESIQFLKPLTIIVGANGSGKTTIIEALKFATSGSLPPLSDGGKSFVHDPKLEGTNLVKAQVKLSFTTPDSKTVLAIRNFQLSQKKAKREFKGMEAVLSTKDEDGRESSISHKCADMERLVPQLMGVSPAVLENVIFCHQEESLWPLSDAKTLKLKFDDIFAATRYTKALENIAKLRKEKASEIKLMEVELKALEANVEQAHKIEDDLANAKSAIAKKASDSDRLGEELKSIEQKLSKLGVKQEEIKQVQEQISTLNAQKDVMMAEKAKANKNMTTDYSDTDEELKAIYENFRQTHIQLLKQIEERTVKVKQLEADCLRSESHMSQLSEKIGRLAAQENDYRNNKKMLTELAAKFGETLSSEGGGYLAILERLQAAVKNKQAELSAAKQSALSLDQKNEELIANLKSEENKILEQIKLKTTQMEQAKAKRGDLVHQITQLESASRQLSSVQEQQKSYQSQLDTILRTHDSDTQSTKSQIETKMRTMQSNTQKLSILSSQRKQLASQAESLAQIKLKRTQLQNLLTMYGDNFESLKRQLTETNHLDSATFPRPLPASDRLKEVFGDSHDHAPTSSAEYRMERLEQQLKKKLMNIKNEIASKGEQLTSSVATVSSLQSQRKGFEDQISSLKKQLASQRKEFQSLDCESLFDGTQNQLEEEIARANKLFEKASNEQMLSSSARLMYKRFIAIAKDSHKCYVCNRDFADANEENQFVVTNTEKMDKLVTVDKSDRNKIATKQAKQRMEQMQALLPIFIASQQIQLEDIPKLESQILQLQSDIAVGNSNKSALDLELSQLRSTESDLVDCLKNANGVARLGADLQSMFYSLCQSERALESEATRSNGGNLDQITNEYEAIEKLNVTLQSECNVLQEKLEAARNHKQSLVDKMNQLKEQVNALLRSVDDRERLKKEEAENRNMYEAFKAEALQLRNKSPSISEALRDLISKRSEDRRNAAIVENERQQELSTLQRQCDQFSSIAEQTNKYEQGIADRVEMKKQLTAQQAVLVAMRDQRSKLAKELEADQDRAQKNEKIDIDIKANLEYRERERAIVQHQKKIDERTSYLRSISGGELIDDLRHLQNKLAKLKEKRSELRGSMQAQSAQCEDYIRTLTSELYHHIDQRYKTKLIDVKTNILANQDLETYHRALDRALMHYHSLKMKEINETLKDYWRTVYKGSDIDEIYIVSDGAIVGSRRNYNYRVVMKQGDTELDMRGRCSAGQKVLASLLIRLALADTFCSQCAVLALDEPTTNLDHKNITAFAQALNQIIEKRREQSNFQLIIITHDETFVDILGRKSHTEHYYRVYKDNAQHSKIRKQVIEAEDEH